MKRFTKLFLAACMLAGFAFSVNAQSVGINADGTAPDNSAMLDVKSTNQGFLLPRLNSSQMNSIASPATGLLVYNTSLKSLCIFDGSIWNSINEGKSCGDFDYEGQNYTTIIIGAQCWMAQNLNVGTRINGGNQSNNSTIEKYCYENIDENCAVYGGLYQWDEMMQYSDTEGVQGICPIGWHLPTNAEWTTLTNYLGGTGVAGGKMKETGTLHWTSPNTGATNSSILTALPGGNIDNGSPSYLGDFGFWWSSTGLSPTIAWGRGLSYAQVFVLAPTGNKSNGYSVRCLKD